METSGIYIFCLPDCCLEAITHPLGITTGFPDRCPWFTSVFKQCSDGYCVPRSLLFLTQPSQFKVIKINSLI